VLGFVRDKGLRNLSLLDHISFQSSEWHNDREVNATIEGAAGFQENDIGCYRGQAGRQKRKGLGSRTVGSTPSIPLLQGRK
jgi:hypothetical protein